MDFSGPYNFTLMGGIDPPNLPLPPYLRHWEKYFISNQLLKLQRTALLSISGALSSAPTLVLNVMLNIPPSDIMAKRYAMTTALRLRKRGSGEGTHISPFLSI